MGSGPNWKAEEVNFLKENYKEMTDEEISVILGRPSGSIAYKRKRLGLLRNNRKYTFDDVVKEFEKTDYELVSVASDYVDAAKNTIKYICPKHREKGIMTISLGHLQSGRGCYFCGREITENAHRIDLSDPRYRELCEAKNLIFKETTRINGKIYVGFVCPEHRDVGVQYMTYHNLNRNTRDNSGCAYCHSSKWENEIRHLLDKLGLRYVTQKVFEDLTDQKPLRFDFFLTEKRKAIEYDGRHHFEPICFNGISKEMAIEEFKETIKRDKMKDEYCLNNNIPLLRIPYYNFNNAESLIKEFAF